MTLIPELHDALARAVAAPRPAARGWWRPSRRAGLLVLGAVVVTGSAVAATSGWHPVIGDGHRGHPSEARAGVPAAQLAALGVLRRAQTDADRGPQVQAVLRLLGRDEINGIHTDAIRTLRQHPDGATILVPTERVGRHDKGYPSTIHRQVLCVFTSVVLTARTFTITGHDGKPKTIHTPGGQGAGQSCGDLNQLRTTGIGGATRSGQQWRVGALVPDGVARVVIRLRRHRTLTAAVRANYYEINTGKELPPAWGTRWLDAQGNTIDHRRIKQPR